MRKPINVSSLADTETKPARFTAGVVGDRKTDAIDVRQTFFIPRSTNARLKQIAETRMTSVQQLLAEATDRWLEANGEAPFYPEGHPRKPGA